MIFRILFFLTFYFGIDAVARAQCPCIDVDNRLSCDIGVEPYRIGCESPSGLTVQIIPANSSYPVCHNYRAAGDCGMGCTDALWFGYGVGIPTSLSNNSVYESAAFAPRECGCPPGSKIYFSYIANIFPTPPKIIVDCVPHP